MSVSRNTDIWSDLTISLALKTGTGYTLGATTSASINLTDNNDVAPPPVVTPVSPVVVPVPPVVAPAPPVTDPMVPVPDPVVVAPIPSHPVEPHPHLLQMEGGTDKSLFKFTKIGH